MKTASQGDWFGQPRGLTILFLTQMWAEFSYFGMRALLVYYMTQQLLIPQGQASLTYGIYTALVFLTPVFGGMLADGPLGRRRAVILGGAIMAIGHFMMTSESLFYPALATIAIGNGLFLPSLPGQIGSLYAPDDPRRNSAYTVYYIGTNLGGFLAPLVCGTLGEIYGWHWGFGAAGVGMIIGLIIYIFGGRKHLSFDQPAAVRTPERAAGAGGDIRRRFLLLGAVALAVIVFRTAYEQIGNTVALWADSGVDRSIADWSIPMTWFQSLNPLVVFTVAPLLIMHWEARARLGKDHSPLRKMAFGAGLVCLAFALLACVAAWANHTGAHPSWIFLAIFFVVMTIGELHILPVGLGLFGKMAPANLTATLIACWYLASFAGNLLAGVFGVLWSDLPNWSFFALAAVVASASALALTIIDRPMRRLEERTKLADETRAARLAAEPTTGAH